jgi:two-component system, NtrC family, sensor kinase
MKWMSDLKLSKRLMASSTIALLVLVGIAIFGGSTVYLQNKITENVLRVSQSRADSASKAQTAILIMGKAQLQLVAASSLTERRSDAVLAIRASSTLDESIQRLQQDLAGDAKVAELSRLLKDIEPAKMRVIRAVSANDVATASLQLHGMEQAMTRVEELSGELVQEENERLLAAVIKQGQQARFTLGVLAALAVGCVILGVVGARHLSTQQATLETERRILRVLIDNIPDSMYVKDPKGRFVVVNAHLAQISGANSPEELIGKTDFDFFPTDLATAFFADEQRVIRSGRPEFGREELGIDRQGKTIHVLTTRVPLRDTNGMVSGIAGIGHDISTRKEAEDALREAERKYRGIFDEATVGIFQTTPSGRFMSANPAMARIFGFDHPAELVDGVTKLAHEFYVDSKRHAEFVLAMDTVGSVQNFESEVYGKDGSKIWIASNCRAILENGAVVRYEGMTENITGRKLLQNQLLQAQKLESVGQLAAGIAHEINTPTQYIGDNVRFLKDAFQELASLLSNHDRLLAAAKDNTVSFDLVQEIGAAVELADAGYLLEEIPKAIEQTMEGVTRVSTLVSAMKEFSHPGTKERTPLDVNHAIQSTLTVARNEWKYVADLEVEFDPSLPLLSCQPGEFNQVILNLIVNGAHAIADAIAKGGPAKGALRVQTRNYQDWAEIRIQDTGLGIPEKVRSRIFDPFFTTKAIGKGTGQGLAIARSVVVDKHNGSIHFETEDGKGTTFIIRLPHDGKTLAVKAVSA